MNRSKLQVQKAASARPDTGRSRLGRPAPHSVVRDSPGEGTRAAEAVRLLFVDDDEADVLMLVRELTRAGHAVQWQRVDTERGLRAAIAGGDWHVAVVDFVLPGFDGLAAVTILSETVPDVPAIVVSGCVGEERVAEAMRTGAQDFLLKGSRDRFVGAVQRELREHELRLAKRQADAALRASEDRYRLLSENLPVVTYLARPGDHGLGITLVSGRAEDLLGHAAQEFESDPFLLDHMVHPDDAAMFKGIDAASLTQAVDLDYRVVLGDGTVKWVRDHSAPRFDAEGRTIEVYGVLEDVTESHSTAAALRAAEKEKDAILSGVRDIVLEHIDCDMRIIWTNRHLTFGGRPGDYVGRHCYEAAHGRSEVCPGCVVRAAMSTGEAGDGEVAFDEDRTVLYRASPLKDERGDVVGVVAAGIDITPRRRAEETARAMSERLELALASGQLGTYEWDITTDEILANERYYGMLGLAPGEVALGRAGWANLVHPDDRPAALKALDAELEGLVGPDEFEYRMRHKDGHWVWVIDRSRVVQRAADGRALKMSGVHIDISARRSAEGALRESEERYRHIVETASEGVWAADESYRVTFVNAQMAGMLRCSAESLIGRPIQEFVFPEDLPRVLELVPSAVLEGRRVEQRLRRADGTELWALVAVSPIIDGEGRIRGASALCSDITDQRRATEQLAAGALQLQRTVEGAVAAMGSAVEMRDPYTAGHQRRVTRLAEAIAHELGLDKAVVQGLRLASQMHDVGKIAVPAEILSKPGRLADNEYQLVQAHSRVGHDILQSIEFDRPVADIVLQHHERIDGSGYPLGLTGGDILIESRILAVADTVEAMASHRPYRPALGLDVALEEVRDGSGTRYDADVVAACLKVCGSAGFAFGD